MIELLDFIKTVTLDRISGSIGAFVLAGILFALIAFVSYRLFPLMRRNWGLWLIHIILTMIIVFSLNAFLPAFVSEQAGIAELVEKTGQTVMLLISALFLQQALVLFFWEGRYLRIYGASPPGLLITLTGAALYILALYIILTVVFKQAMTGLLVSSSIVAAVIGLAMQDSLSDLVAGIAISVERPFRLGDWIETEEGTRGEVVDVNWRATHIKSGNNSLYIIPNAKISNARIHNFSMPEKTYGYFFYVYIPAAFSPILVRQILLEACLKSEKVLTDPPPTVRANQAGLSYRYQIYVYFENYPTHFTGRDEVINNIWVHCARYNIEPSAEGNEVMLRKDSKEIIDSPSPARLLEEAGIFSSLSEEEKLFLVGRMKVKVLSAGTTVFEQGSTGSSLYIVAFGQVNVEISFTQKEKKIVSMLQAGDFFGEMSLLADAPRSATVSSHTDCQLLELDRKALQILFDSHPDLIDLMARAIAERRLKNRQIQKNLSKEEYNGKLNTMADKLILRMKSIFIKA
jgi:small-conductance mechanosensitive channel/CRP-like cAMP-binding protein